MRLSSTDIREQEFKRVLRGFDPLEVEAFLEMVADEYDSMQKANAELKEKAAKLEERVREIEKVEGNLKKTLTEAQYSADASKVSSRKEADLVVKEAEFHADRLTEEARRESARLRSELAMLHNHKKQLTGRLKQLLSSQLELIKILEIEDVDAGIVKKNEEPAARTAPAYTPLLERDSAAAKRQDAPRTAEKPPRSAAAQKSPPVEPPKAAEERIMPKREEIKDSRQAPGAGLEPAERKSSGDAVPPEIKTKKDTNMDTDDLIDRMILEHERREEELRQSGRKRMIDTKETA